MRFSIYNFCHFNQICISYNPIKRWFLTVILSFQYNVYHIIVNQHKNFSVKLQLIKEKQQKNLNLEKIYVVQFHLAIVYFLYNKM